MQLCHHLGAQALPARALRVADLCLFAVGYRQHHAAPCRTRPLLGGSALRHQEGFQPLQISFFFNHVHTAVTLKAKKSILGMPATAMRGLSLVAILMHTADAFLAQSPLTVVTAAASARGGVRAGRALKMTFPSFLPPAEMAEVEDLAHKYEHEYKTY